MLDSRWIDKQAWTMTPYVQYRRDGLTYLHWVSGSCSTRIPPNP
jgi:hypothetical protein